MRHALRILSFVVVFAGNVFATQKPLLSACEGENRLHCGGWSVGGYYSVSPDGYWFGGIYAGGEYFILPNLAIGASLSPGVGDGYFYLSPSLDASYYLWEKWGIEFLVVYGYRYFYDWPLKKGDAESSGTFHGPGVSAVYGITEHLYSGLNISYQWIQFGGENYREWYLTIPLNYAF